MGDAGRRAAGAGSSAYLETVRDLLGARDSGQVLERIAERARGLLTEDTVAVYIEDAEEGELKAAAAAGLFADTFAGEVIRRGDGILGAIALRGEGEIVNNVVLDPRAIIIANTPETQENEKLMGAPLRSGGRTIGVMAIWRDVGEPPFTEEDLSTLEGLCGLASIAIENARSYEEAQLRIARLSGLIEIGRVLVAARDPALILEAVHQQMSRIYDTTNFYVATYRQGSGEWRWELHYEGGERQPVEVHELGAGLTGHIITTRSPVLLRSKDEIRSFLEGQGVQGLGDLPQSWLGVPLVAGDEITGVMAIQDYHQPGRYKDADLEFFLLVGTTVAVAIQNARLFKEAEEALEGLRNAQKQLVLQEKMAVLGGLVSGVAHEINTPVGVAMTAVTFLHEQARELAGLIGGRPETGREATRCLEGISESAELTEKNLARAAELIASFKQISADQASGARRRFRLGTYIAEVVQSLHPRLKQTPISVEIDCPEDLELDSYPGAFSQILTNFIINSLIHGFREMPDKPVIRIKARRSGDEMLELAYADNGAGMDPSALGRLFEPFYTTRRGSGGTGLGTTIAYNLVTQRLRGEIEAESVPEAGLCYLMRIPLQPPREERACRDSAR